MLIDFLPQIGVAEKKTHSSSLDIEHAELARKHFRELADAGSGGGGGQDGRQVQACSACCGTGKTSCPGRARYCGCAGRASKNTRS